MNVMSGEKGRRKFLHQDMSEQSFSRRGIQERFAWGMPKRRKANWAKRVAETPQAEGAAEVKVLLQEGRRATVQGTKGRIRLDEG